jgi:hypothetical protein
MDQDRGQARRKAVTTTLLTAACAGMLSSTAARATPFVETTDFGNTFFDATDLPAGTDFVQGTLTNLGIDVNDYFRLTGLPANQSINVQYTALTTTLVSLDIQALNNSQGTLGSTSRFFGPGDGTINGSFPITVPADGVVVGHLDTFEGGAGSVAYTFAVPEPSSAAALVGLSALALLGRRKSDPPEV